jgi:hypothetical protein
MFVGTVLEGKSLRIGGLEVWKHEWHDTRAVARVRDPVHDQEFTFHVFEIRSGDTVVRFAAGEFSNGVWGFYVGAR